MHSYACNSKVAFLHPSKMQFRRNSYMLLNGLSPVEYITTFVCYLARKVRQLPLELKSYMKMLLSMYETCLLPVYRNVIVSCIDKVCLKKLYRVFESGRKQEMSTFEICKSKLKSCSKFNYPIGIEILIKTYITRSGYVKPHLN